MDLHSKHFQPKTGGSFHQRTPRRSSWAWAALHSNGAAGWGATPWPGATGVVRRQRSLGNQQLSMEKS